RGAPGLEPTWARHVDHHLKDGEETVVRPAVEEPRRVEGIGEARRAIALRYGVEEQANAARGRMRRVDERSPLDPVKNDLADVARLLDELDERRRRPLGKLGVVPYERRHRLFHGRRLRICPERFEAGGGLGIPNRTQRVEPRVRP